MLLILDYDETYTACPPFWDMFIENAKVYGHHVVCCTMRHEEPERFNSDVILDMSAHSVEIVYAASHKDKWEAVQKAGYHPENAVWIDDRPMFIYMNRSNEEYNEL